MNYLSVEIYRPDYDCTNNGVTSLENAHGKRFVVPCINGNWTQEEVEKHGFIVLDIERRSFGGEEYTNLRPACAGNSWTMMGGNFAYTSDARFKTLFRNAFQMHPLPVHDRIE